MSLVAPVDLTEATAGCGHVAQFYSGPRELAQAVSGFLGARLAARGAAVVIATPEHSELFRAALVAGGVDVAAARAMGRYVEMDPEELLASFMAGGQPDREAFESAVTPILERVGQGNRPVAVYGEMVALLWERGEVDAVMRLEELWNDLRKWEDFTLFCGYRSSEFETDEAARRRVCGHHDRVVSDPEVPEVTESEALQRFEATLFAVPAARRFAKSVLREWGHVGSREPVELVVTELATNAVVHAGGRFCVRISRTPHGLRIAVTDSAHSSIDPALEPRPRPAAGGRGLPLVKALSTRWGVELHTPGKTVWAEVT